MDGSPELAPTRNLNRIINSASASSSSGVRIRDSTGETVANADHFVCALVVPG